VGRLSCSHTAVIAEGEDFGLWPGGWTGRLKFARPWRSAAYLRKTSTPRFGNGCAGFNDVAYSLRVDPLPFIFSRFVRVGLSPLSIMIHDGPPSPNPQINSHKAPHPFFVGWVDGICHIDNLSKDQAKPIIFTYVGLAGRCPSPNLQVLQWKRNPTFIWSIVGFRAFSIINHDP
jgi:hypothetical protein